MELHSKSRKNNGHRAFKSYSEICSSTNTYVYFESAFLKEAYALNYAKFLVTRWMKHGHLNMVSVKKRRVFCVCFDLQNT